MRNVSVKSLMRTGVLISAMLVGYSITSIAQTFHSVDMTTVKLEYKKCKYFRWSVRFKVPKLPRGGWIVQEIKFKKSIVSCEVPPRHGSNEWSTYYEAWEVKPNQDSSVSSWGNPTNPPGVNHNDSYWWTIPNNTKGKISWQGTFIFIENPAGGGSALDSTWTPGGVPLAGGLMSTYNTPAFWAAALASGKAKKHNAYLEWVCCGTNDTIIVDTAVTAKEVTFVVYNTVVHDDGTVEVVPDTLHPEGNGTMVWGDPTQLEDYESYEEGDTIVWPDTTVVGPAKIARASRSIYGSNNLMRKYSSSHTAGTKNSSSVLRAYPLPATDRLVIDYGALLNKDVTIRIMNLSGQLLKQQSMHLLQRTELDISDLPRGIYLVLVNSKDGTYSGNCKVVK